MDLSNVRWRKSSYTGDNGGNCVEIAELWRKSSHSGNNGGNCVEVSALDRVAVRDSKNPDGPKLVFDRAEWGAFVHGLKADDFAGK
ncbi:DUF397 domain-containing protein [Sphaerisporangium album]|uniref:DUF397 domain-containing protein n=1 Tax=Sphaerisporangium album TaxID=509200 RepID=A0A367FNM1_9ACTN|nr:DUF397 domain-containing protein [Sphaerisporangium album]RCG31834.1 DUF397 domain-containing protein [Sphaerisporangium album]